MNATVGKNERALWPDWCSEHPWLSNFLSTVEEEARERSDRGIEDFHFSLALTRDEVGAGDLRNHLGFDPRKLRDRINVRLGANAGILLERLGSTSAAIESKTLDELYWDGPLQLTQQAREALAAARIEADKHGEGRPRAHARGSFQTQPPLWREFGPNPSSFGDSTRAAHSRPGS